MITLVSVSDSVYITCSHCGYKEACAGPREAFKEFTSTDCFQSNHVFSFDFIV